MKNSRGQEKTLKQQHNLFNVVTKLFYVAFIAIFYSLVKLIKNLFTGKRIKNISNQLAIVTGGGNGLGKEISLRLAQEGCNVLIADIDLKSAEKTADEIRKMNVNAKAYKVDVSNWDAVNEFKTKVLNEFDSVDILVNNAGILPTAHLLEISPELIKKAIEVNLLSNCWTCKAFLDGMVEQRRGHIVAINSILGLTTVPRGSIYATTKFGLNGFMASLQMDLLIKNQDFIKITNVHPYFIETNPELLDFVNKYDICRFLPALKPFFVADKIVKAILNEDYRIILPGWMKYLLGFLRFLPEHMELNITKLFFKLTDFKFFEEVK